MEVNREYVKNNLLKLLKNFNNKSRSLKSEEYNQVSMFNDLDTAINSSICDRIIDELCNLEKYPVKTPYLSTEKATFTMRKYLGVYGRGFSYEEIGNEMNINKESVKSKVLRFVEKLAFQYACHNDIKEEKQIKIFNKESYNELNRIENEIRVLTDKMSIIISQLYNETIINSLSDDEKKKVYKK